ncbi:MAG: hypothetical protein ACI81R_002437 [Bradymonadia bacterium]|jgi:hypothetical protein
MHVPLQRSVLPGIEEYIGPTEQLLIGVRGVGKLGDGMTTKAFGVSIVGSIAASLFVHEGFAAMTIALVVLGILNATPYALVLTDTSALIVRLSRRGRVLEVQRFDRDAFPAARAWSTSDETQLRIALDPPLTISNPKMLDRSHPFASLMVPLSIDMSEVQIHGQTPPEP